MLVCLQTSISITTPVKHSFCNQNLTFNTLKSSKIKHTLFKIHEYALLNTSLTNEHYGDTMIKKITLLWLILLSIQPAHAIDSTLDLSFNPDISSQLLAIAIQSNGQILISGDFFDATGIMANSGIMRLTPEGLIDASFNVPTIDSQPFVLAVQADNKILLAGNFTTINDTERNGIARLNPDGSLDLDFDPNVTGNGNSGLGNSTSAGVGIIRAMTLDSQQRILIGGFFDSVGTTERSFLARLQPDGNLDTTFTPIIDESVRAIAIDSNNRIVIGGNFDNVNEQARDNVARLLEDNGDLDMDFTGPTISGDNDLVRSLTVQPDNKVLIGGIFTTVDDLARDRLARLNADGSHDTDFVPPAAIGTSTFFEPVRAMVVQADGKILVGGSFSSLSSDALGDLIRLNADGSLDPLFTPVVRRSVFSVIQLADNAILIAGSITSVSGVRRSGIARLIPDEAELCLPITANNGNIAVICL